MDFGWEKMVMKKVVIYRQFMWKFDLDGFWVGKDGDQKMSLKPIYGNFV